MRRPRRRSLKQRVYRWLYRGLLSLAVGAALYVVIADQLTAAQWGAGHGALQPRNGPDECCGDQPSAADGDQL